MLKYKKIRQNDPKEITEGLVLKLEDVINMQTY